MALCFQPAAVTGALLVWWPTTCGTLRIRAQPVSGVGALCDIASEVCLCVSALCDVAILLICILANIFGQKRSEHSEFDVFGGVVMKVSGDLKGKTRIDE